MRIISKIALCISLLLLLASNSNAQKQSPQPSEPSCRVFVQKFYDSWLKGIEADLSLPDHILKSTGSAITPELAGLLKEWAAAEKKAEGEIVGPDFDVILNSQDPSDRYVVEKISRNGDHYFAEVYGVLSGKKSANPDVIAEMVFSDGGWKFVNFHYHFPDGSKDDLINMLKASKKEWQN